MGSEGTAGFKARIDVAEGQLFGTGTGEEGEAVQEIAPRQGGTIRTGKRLGGKRPGSNSALVAKMLDFLAFGCEVKIVLMRQHGIKRYQLGLLIAAIAAAFVTDSSAERPEPHEEHLSIVGDDMSAAMAAFEQIDDEVFAPFARSTPIQASNRQLAKYSPRRETRARNSASPWA